MQYDYLIVGAGFFGSICAHELTKAGKKVLVIDSRDHIGGNCYTENKDGINIQVYGAHIFHTSNKEVWDWVNQFAEFNTYRHHVLATYDNEIYSLPFSMWTFNKLWGVNFPHEAQEKIKEQSLGIDEPTNLEEQAIKLVGRDVYEKLIKGYTQIFEKLLDGIDVQLNTNYFDGNLPQHNKVIFTGPIDKFFGYKYGKLEYKTVRFEHNHLNQSNYQGVPVMNYTNYEIPYTRIIEHKHFEGVDTDTTWITHEYPTEYIPDVTDPYYPVNDKENNETFFKYKEEAEKVKDCVLFGGRLGEYKYYDMHQVIESALNFIKKEI